MQQPPELPEPQPAGMRTLLTVVPGAVMSAGMVLMYAGSGSGQGGHTNWMPMTMMGVGMAGMMGAQAFSGAGDRRHQTDGDRRDYLRFLSQSRRRIRKAAEQQRKALAWVHPDPQSLWSLALTTRLWERRPSHPDFGELRLGTGSQRLGIRIAAPQTKPVEDLDPVTAKALRRFIRAYTQLTDQPVALFIRAFGQIQVDGEREHVLGLVRALLAQLTVFHGPDDVRLGVCIGTAQQADWDWVKWLPHNQHPSEQDAAGALRLVAESVDDLEHLLGPEFSARARFDPSAAPNRDEPLVVVVNDGGMLSPRSRLLAMGYRNCVLIDLDGIGLQTDVPKLRLDTDGTALEKVGVDRIGRPQRQRLAAPDQLSLPRMRALARLIARHEVPGTTEVQAEESLTVDRDLPSLLGVHDVHDFDAPARWMSHALAEELCVPIGTAGDGTPLVLDIRESAQGGMGPHGLLIGATGSGKSELLRTLVLSLTMTHSSESLNLVLVDFKGGATFAGLDGMPHVAAVITNLADEATMVDRMRDALHGEMVRRQELLRASGKFASRRDYETARRRGARLDPLPTLFVVVDEFSELISTHPDFIELFVMIGRLGRSLGVHLLLASQRLDEGRIGVLEGHLSYRIGLRTFSAMESRSVIGVPDAYELPNAPGHGFLRSDVSTITRFRAAYVSGPARRSARRADQDVIAAQVVPFGCRPVPIASAPATAWPDADADADKGSANDPTRDVDAATGADAEDQQVRSILDVVIDRIKGQGPPAHQVWLPPLDRAPTLDRLLPPLLPDPEHGLRPLAGQSPRRLTVPVGIIDKPFEQARDLLTLDLSGTGGHVGIAGGPQSGKSTLVRTLISALALTHSPREVQFLCLDFGGGGLAALGGLPHVGGVCGRLDPERVNRTVAEIIGLVADRERRFGELGIDSMAGYRAAAAAGRLRADENTADVFLVVDGWSTIRQEFDDAELALRQTVSRGLSYGVHLIVAAGRWADLHHAMRDQIGTRLELKLGDSIDSVIDMRVAATVPAHPGRGLTPDRLHFLAALPRIDGVDTADDITEGIRDVVDAVADCWAGPGAMTVRTLPAVLPAAELPPPEGAVRAAIGIDESQLEPVWHDFADLPHLSVMGDAESGKSNLLRLVLKAVTARTTPADARILVVDQRRELFELVPPEQRLGLAVSADTTRAAVGDAVAGLRERIPGPQITPEQLRRRDWWAGPELYVVVDDFDLMIGPENPLLPLVPLLPQAGDIGLHVIVARAAAGSMRTNNDQFMRRLQELNTPDVVLSCPREEGPLLGGTRPRILPPGRALLCTRRGSRLIQTGFVGATADVGLTPTG